MKCTACNRELNKKDTVYTEGKAPFCNNPFECNEQHPNSVEGIVSRGGAIKLYTESELDNELFANLDVSPKLKERIIKVATKPQSIRLSKIDIASYLVQLQETHGMSSLSEAIRYCVTIAMNTEDNTPPTPREPEVITVSVQEPKGIKVVVPEIEKEEEPEPAPIETF